MKLRSVVLAVLSILLLSIVVLASDLSALPNYLRSHVYSMVVLVLLYLVLYMLRLLRNYTLFRYQDYTSVDLLRFLPDGLVAGVVATYGPLKSGELLAVEIYEDKFGIDRGQSLSVIVFGRVLDVIIILLFVASAAFSLTSLASTNLTTYLIIMTIILGIVITILMSERVGHSILAFIQPLCVWHLKRVYATLEGLAENYYQEISKLSKPVPVLILVAFSIARWGLEVIFFGLVFASFNFGLSIIEVVSVVGFSYAIGVSSGTPGGLGTAQLTAIGILTIIGIPTGAAALALLIATSLSIICNVALALIGLITTPLVSDY